jgi:hypothetical protein
MALYRETATGFIQEHATDPGAGYTLISTMPTTSITARAEWWRDVDIYNQTSDWHPSLDSGAEDPNDNLLAVEFTNESALVSADSNGNVTDGFLGATTQVRIMRGSQNVTVTEGWSLGLAKNPDVAAFTYTWTGTDVKTLQITGFPTDTTSGYIRITATRTGSSTLVKDFKILKVIRGADGTDGTDGVRGSRQIVVSGTSWSDAAAWDGIVAQTGTVPVLSDLVTIANAGTGFSTSKFYAGGAYDGNWTEPSSYINGNLLVTGTVGANKLVTGSITTSYLSFTPVQAGGSASDINAYTTTIDGAKITTGTVTALQIAANTITAAKIATGTITTTQLAFTPVQSTNVVASINATAEGIRIAGNRITIDGTVSFGSGYDPSGKISSGGAATDINNNVTTISGGKITTGSLNADRIVAGTITADRIVIGGIDSSRLSSGAVGQVARDYTESAAVITTSDAQFLSTSIAAVSYTRSGVLISASVEVRNTSAYISADRVGSVITYHPSDATPASHAAVYVEVRKNGTRISPSYIRTDLSIYNLGTIINYSIADPNPGTAAATYTFWLRKVVTYGNDTYMYSGTLTATELRR